MRGIHSVLPLVLVGAGSLLFAACGGASVPTAPSSTSSNTAAGAGGDGSIAIREGVGPNGSFTWQSIMATRPLCTELTSQVGHSWPIWVQAETQGTVVTVTISESPLPPRPFDDPPAVFTGTREGDSIVAVRTGGMGGMACPHDESITPQTGGSLRAVVSGSEISGEYTDVFGDGPSQVAFVFSFHASL
jgi:hypothetical protein